MTANANTGRVAALEGLLGRISDAYSPAALASSLSIEDMVITDAIFRTGVSIEVFTLDTGRMHADTLNVIAAIRSRYGREIAVFRPQPSAVDEFEQRFGRDAFYGSVDLRKHCCAIRKVEPLKRALAAKKAWLTGMRRDQSVTRIELPVQAFDPAHGMEKFNPLADWSEQDAWDYVRTFDVPYNALYDQGYRSIGCAPCSRPVVAGEDLRAGRWWWEQPESKECGLHVGADGRLQREKATA